ncbi:MAG: T9SS type A sorting domain-containing protein [Bacteroidetes bacterium]|nr:T9SS type A sorting domain-containing protein [Bacteroidota bacterium]HET6245709.1 glycosyl hydrolase family 18 protein [Bacteroidia bacterium]
MNKTIALAMIFIAPTMLFSQVPEIKSLHKELHEQYKSINISASEYEQLNQAVLMPLQQKRNCQLNKIVFGWHPYWMNGLQTNYQWDLLTDFSYFSYDVNPNNGQAYTTNSWSTAASVTSALANGVRVNLCVTLFGSSNHTTFLTNATAQQTLITNLINLVQARGAHGVNIDFEEMASAQKNNLTTFITNLCNQMHAAIPNSQVSIALPAVDWGNAFDVAAMNPYIDLFIIMGYDYYWGGSTQAGPTDPAYTFDATVSSQNISRSINTYLNKGIPNSKLILGLPYYGREWNTTTDLVPSNATSHVAARTYKFIKDNSSGNYSNPNFYLKSMTNYHTYYSGSNWRQCFINNAFTLGKRYDMVNQRNIGGIGIWSLGGDDGYTDLWNKIEEKFTNCSVISCTDTIYDMGGPMGDYYNDENFTFVISPTGATQVNMNFSSFNLGTGDTLKIYNGNSVGTSLIGNYTGANLPATINSLGNALTLSFKSNASGVGSGWGATWNCIMDAVSPTTQITPVATWVTQDFLVSFLDSDNQSGSGVDKSFYTVSDFNGDEWRSNSSRGFFTDNFNTVIHADWINYSGTWNTSNSFLVQSNEALDNTNISTALTQNLSNRYLYHWKGKIEGTGTNKRAGLHFFSDNPSLPNRGNSYFVYFRTDNNKVQFYKVANDVFTLVEDISYTVNEGQWYDYKVSFDRITGKAQVWIDNLPVLSWIDPAPYQNGTHISFRSGNCNWSVDSLSVLRSRSSNSTVNVGLNNNDDIRYQNMDPLTSAGIIKSVVSDSAGNISTLTSMFVNVDWTAPDDVTIVNDGTGSDINYTLSSGELSANWLPSFDPHSGLEKYLYSIGTSAGLADVVNWTDNSINSFVTHTGLSLTHGQTYYFSIQAINEAGLLSSISNSDGQIVDLNTGGLTENHFAANTKIHPNPTSNKANVIFNNPSDQKIKFILFDNSGREIENKEMFLLKGMNHFEFDFLKENISEGLYFIQIIPESNPAITLKLIYQK